MNCFNHRDRPAVGLCKSCGKALCGDCITELPNGVACKDSCEDRVSLINHIIDRNSQVLAAARRQVQRSSFFIMLIGAGLLILSIFALIQSERSFFSSFVGFMGFVIFVGGILRLSQKSPFPESDENKWH